MVNTTVIIMASVGIVTCSTSPSEAKRSEVKGP